MTSLETIDGRRLIDVFITDINSKTLTVRRYNSGYRASIFVFGSYGVAGVLSIDDGVNGKAVLYNPVSNHVLSTSLVTDDKTTVQFTLHDLGAWGFYTLIGCNCYFV